MIHRIGLSIFAMALSLAVPGESGLPVAVDGQALPSLAPMLDRVTPTVANISTTTIIQATEHPLLSDPFFRRFFDLPKQRKKPKEKMERSLGSGVVVDAGHGYLVTNHHVIKDADRITVTLPNGRTLKAKRVGSDPDADVAIIQVPADNLQAITLGNSEKLRVGDFVVAIGNPFGLGQTVTSGIVSAMGRRGLGIEGYEDFIQTDASINPGNSGGALVDLRGELVGINTAILAKGGGSVGIGFAIPVDMVRQIMAQLVQYGEVRRGVLGVQTQDLTPELAEAFKLETSHLGGSSRRGAVVVSVASGSTAAKAGIKSGDILLQVNGTPVENGAHIRTLVGLARVGEQINIKLLREGHTMDIAAEIGELGRQKADGENIHRLLTGAVLEGQQLADTEEGVVVVVGVERKSAASRIGLRKGDIILSINKRDISSIEDMGEAAAGSEGMLLSIKRGSSILSVLVQ